METQINKIIEGKTDSGSIELIIDNILQSFQEIDRVVDQLVADNKASPSSCNYFLRCTSGSRFKVKER